MRSVQKVTLTEAVIQEILSQVRDGRLAPGDRLPPEKTLMQQLGVSRPVLREALRSLATMNVIHIRPGYGAIVCDVENTGVVNSDLLSLVLDRGKELEDLHQARVVLEVALAGWAAERATEEDWQHMEECVENLRLRHEQEDADHRDEPTIPRLGFSHGNCEGELQSDPGAVYHSHMGNHPQAPLASRIPPFQLGRRIPHPSRAVRRS